MIAYLVWQFCYWLCVKPVAAWRTEVVRGYLEWACQVAPYFARGAKTQRPGINQVKKKVALGCTGTDLRTLLLPIFVTRRGVVSILLLTLSRSILLPSYRFATAQITMAFAINRSCARNSQNIALHIISFLYWDPFCRACRPWDHSRRHFELL